MRKLSIRAMLLGLVPFVAGLNQTARLRAPKVETREKSICAANGPFASLESLPLIIEGRERTLRRCARLAEVRDYPETRSRWRQHMQPQDEVGVSSKAKLW